MGFLMQQRATKRKQAALTLIRCRFLLPAELPSLRLLLHDTSWNFRLPVLRAPSCDPLAGSRSFDFGCSFLQPAGIPIRLSFTVFCS